MRIPFEVGYNRLIYIKAVIFGHSRAFTGLPMILDTGASTTVIHSDYLTAVGYNLKKDAFDQENLVTGSGLVKANRIRISLFRVLGFEKTDFVVCSYPLPPQTMIGGILGNDFLETYRLTIDFPQQWIEIVESFATV